MMEPILSNLLMSTQRHIIKEGATSFKVIKNLVDFINRETEKLVLKK